MKTPRGVTAKYPWRKMEVGDTFLVQNKTTSSLKGCVHHLKPALRFRFKQVVVDGVKCVRVWRIA